MRKRLILVLALALVAGLTMAAYAEVQNVKVSGDITVQQISRTNLYLNKRNGANGATVNGGADFDPSLNVGLLQTRVKIEADLTDNVMATVRLLNEKTWGSTETTTNTNIDLDLAYVSLKEFLYSPLSLVIGRQNLRYGNGLVVGDPDTNGISAGHGTSSASAGTILPKSIDDLSLRKSFDAIKAVLNYDPLVVDLFWSKNGQTIITGVQDKSSTHLLGINAAYAVNKELNAEVYTFERIRESSVAATTNNSKAEKLLTSGAKVTYTGIKNLILGLEGAGQYGDHLANTALYVNEGANNNKVRKVNAYAIQAVGNYVRPDKKYKPQVGGSYTYLSGDKPFSVGGHYRGWDPMYEDQAGGTLFNKILGYSNAQLINVNGSVMPIEDVKVGLNYYYLQLNQPYQDAPAASSVNLSGVAGDPTYKMKPYKKSLGQEIDLGVTYDYTEDVQFGLNAGAFVPGAAFDKINKETAKQVIGSMKVTF